MKKKWKTGAALCALAAFALWTAAIQVADVQPIGPEGSKVGFAQMNGFVHEWTGVCLPLYTLTDWLSLIPLTCMAGFACLGCIQWIQRKKLLAVDSSLLMLGGFYLVVLAAYLLFEVCVINTRPVLLEGRLEPSYPSSTTVLVLCVMPVTLRELRGRLRRKGLKRGLSIAIRGFSVLMVLGRTLSGVHWITDIIGGILLSAGLTGLYGAFSDSGE